MNPYYTHRPYLIDCLNKLENKNKKQKVKILELGVGDGSSEIFNSFAQKNKNFSIKGFDNDKGWVDSMKSKFELKNYKFESIDSWQSFLDSCDKSYYDLVFIDQAPWEARISSLDFFINKSDTIILHDYDYYNKGVIENIFDVSENSFFGKYLLENFSLKGFNEQLPPTLIFTKNQNE
jgi:hypothetical protein